MDAIDDRTRAEHRFQAALHGRTLVGDEVDPNAGAAAVNRSYGAMQRMKARHRARGGH